MSNCPNELQADTSCALLLYLVINAVKVGKLSSYEIIIFTYLFSTDQFYYFSVSSSTVLVTEPIITLVKMECPF